MREEIDSEKLIQQVQDLRNPIVSLLQSLPASVKPQRRDLYGMCRGALRTTEDDIQAFPDWSDFGDAGFGDESP